MKKLVSVLACALMVFSLAGCGSSKDSTSGKTVTIAKENDLISMDSTYATDGMSLEMIAATVEGLETVDKDGNVIPALAESYEMSKDGLTYTFKLRDAKWDNDKPVTAADFVYAWKRAVSSSDVEYAYLFTEDGACIKGAADIVAAGTDEEKAKLKDQLGVKAVDDKTLEVTLSKKCEYFLSLMAFPVFFPVNEEFAEAQGDQYAITPDNMLANGPFKMTKHDLKSKVEFKKNEKYWDAANVKVDNFVVNIVPQVSTSAADFESGNCDYTKLNSALVDKYKNDKDKYKNILEGYLWYLQYNIGDGVDTGNKYLANKNIRLALSYAFDRQELANTVLKDGSIAAEGFIPKELSTGPDGKDYRETAPAYYTENAADSVKKAQEYWEKGLQELGVKEITLKLLFEPSDPAKPAAEYLQSQLQKNLPGLTIEMVQQEKNNRIEMQKKRETDITLTRWGPDYADPTTYLNLMLKGNSYNYGDYVSEAYNAKMQDAANAADAKARWTALQEAEKILLDDAAVSPVFQTGGASLINPKVTGIENHTVGVPFIYKNLDKAE